MKTGKDILLLYIFSFFKNMLFFGAVAVPFYLHRIGLDYTGMFILEAIFSLSMIVFEIPTGVVADRWGRKISLFLGSCFFGAGFLLFGIFTPYYMLIIAEIICALGMTLLSGADRAIVYEILKDAGRTHKAGTVMARYDAAGTAGMLIGFPAGSLFTGSGIVPYNSALGIVFIATAAAVFTGGLIVLFVKEGPFEKSTKNPMKQGLDGFLNILKIPDLRLFSFNYAFISSLTFFMFWFYQSLLMANNVPVSYMGIVASALNLTAMILLLFTPMAEKSIGIKNTLFLSSIIPGVLYLLLSFISGPVMAFIAIFGITNMKIFRAPLLNALMIEMIESTDRATVLSGVSMIERISTTILYPLAGILSDISLEITFLIMGTITVVLSIILRIEEDAIKNSMN
jgi:MFS family permease